MHHCLTPDLDVSKTSLRRYCEKFFFLHKLFTQEQKCLSLSLFYETQKAQEVTKK